MREYEDAMMKDTASRRGYAPTAAWDEGNMIQAMARMKNPTIAWRFGDGLKGWPTSLDVLSRNTCCSQFDSNA